MTTISRYLLGTAGALALLTGAACRNNNNNNDAEGDLSLSYVLLIPDENNLPAAAFTCADASLVAVNDANNTLFVRVAVGDDDNGNGILEANEEVESVASSCNQLDANGNGDVEANELGLFTGTFGAGTFDLFSVSLQDVGANPVQFELAQGGDPSDNFSFGGGIEVFEDDNFDIIFLDDAGNPQGLIGEIQIFIGF